MKQLFKGSITELRIAAAILKYNYPIYFPFGQMTRSDLIFEYDKKLFRVQCKTGKYDLGVIKTYIRSVNNMTQESKDYSNQIDYFGIYCPQLDKCYLIHIQNCPKQALTLRVDPPENGQTFNIKWAKDYEI